MQASYTLTIPMLHMLEHGFPGVTAEVMVMAAATAAPVAAPVVAPVAEKKPKAPSKALGQATAWGDFTKKVCAEQAEALAAFKAASESKAGVMPKFMAVYRKSNPDVWASFQEQWLVAHPKAEAAEVPAPVAEPAPKPKKVKKAEAEVPVVSSEPKPKKVLSPEHLAKMKAGREAKKAAAAAGGEVPVKLERMLLPILERSPSPKDSKEKED